MPAGDRFVEVPADAMFAFLKSKGFTESKDRSRWEVVYEFRHKQDPRYRIFVYTSFSKNQSVARGLGKDAIRVVAIFEVNEGGSGRGIKSYRVFRTGTVDGVLERMYQRMRQAYDLCNKDRKRSTWHR